MNLSHATRTQLRGRASAIAAGIAALAMLFGLVSATPTAAAEIANIAVGTDANDNPPNLEVSYGTSWNSNAAINDGDNSATNTYSKMWGTWGDPSNPTADTATYTWDKAVTVSSSKLYLWQNYGTGDGGVRIPASWSLDYLDSSGDWMPMAGASLSYPLPPFDEASPVSSLPVVTAEFDPVTTTAVRLTLVRSVNSGTRSATSVIEWEVYGFTAPVEPVEEPTYLEVEQVAVRTSTGTAPVLPDEVWVIGENGPLQYLAVTWPTIPASSYESAGQFEVSGALAADSSQEVTATVFVTDQPSSAIQRIEYSSTITTPGVAPVLPTTVYALYDDDTASSTVAVTWDQIAPEDYAAPETFFDVQGSVDGYDGHAIVTVWVVQPSDQALPIVSVSIDPAPQGSGWYTSAPQATVNAQPTKSPLTSVEFSLDDGETWSAYTEPFDVPGQGDITVRARATAEDGEVGEDSAAIKIDTVAPATQIEVQRTSGSAALVTLVPTDEAPGSGVSRTVWSDGPDESPTGGANNMYATYEQPFSVQLTEASRYLHVRTQDAAGNEEETQTILLPSLELANTSVLTAVVGIADGLVAKSEVFTDESVDALRDALAEARVVLEDAGSVTQDRVDAAAAELQAAINELVVKPSGGPAVDRTVLQSVLDGAKTLSNAGGKYTAGSWSKLQGEIADAKEVLADESATQAQVNQAAIELNAALTALDPVSAMPVRVKLNQSQLRLVKGKSLKLEEGVYFSGGAPTSYAGHVTWKSSNPKVATVSSSGTVRAKKAGTVTITVTTTQVGASGKKLSTSIRVTVVKSKPKSKVTKVTASVPKSLKKGQIVYITGKYSSSKAAGVKVSYKSSKRSVADIDKVGRIIAKGKGTAKITVKAGSKSKTYKVTVR